MPLPANHLVIDWTQCNVTLTAALQWGYVCNNVGQLFSLASVMFILLRAMGISSLDQTKDIRTAEVIGVATLFNISSACI